MQDRSYAIVMVIILAFCCMGMCVAVTGYLNGRPPSLSSIVPGPSIPATLLVVFAPTDTPHPAPMTATSFVTPTSGTVVPPLGALQTLVLPSPAGTTGTDSSSPVPRPAQPTSIPTQAPPPPQVQSCAGFSFCPVGGPPDAQLAPTNDRCPRNYIWGRVVDLAKKGIPDVQIRFRGPLGNIDTVVSKAPPDPPGIYNILAPPPGGRWTIWVVDAGGKPLSSQITISAPQVYSGSGNCPNRVDFVQQR